MEALTNPTIEHVTVVTQAGWVSPVVTLTGVALTALVSWLIYRGNVSRADKRASEEASRHRVELRRLRKESQKAEERHTQQIDAMLRQGRRAREVAFLRELSDDLVMLSTVAGRASAPIERNQAARLRQYALKAQADFPEDDADFAEGLSSFLESMAIRVEDNWEGPSWVGKDVAETILVGLDAERAATLVLCWLNPPEGMNLPEKFRNYALNGDFENRPHRPE